MTTATTHPLTADQSVTIRPIRPSDDAMEGEFIRNLSMETKHYRFLGGVKELSPAELKRLCDVDGRHSMAFVATTAMRDLATELGMSVRCDPDDANQVIYSVTL